MKPLLKQILLLFLITKSAFSQFRSDIPIQSLPTNLNGELETQPSFSLLDLNRIDINHGFTMSMISNGGQSFSIAALNNQVSYLALDNLRLDANISLYKIQNPFQSKDLSMNQLDIAYDAGITYRPTKNSFFQLRFQNNPHYQKYQTHSPFFPRSIK